MENWGRPFRKIEEKLQKVKEEKERRAKEQEEVIQKMKSASSCINFKGVLKAFVKVLPPGTSWREGDDGLSFYVESDIGTFGPNCRIAVHICLKRVPEHSDHYITVRQTYLRIPLEAVTEKNLYIQIQKAFPRTDFSRYPITIPLKNITEEKLANALAKAWMD